MFGIETPHGRKHLSVHRLQAYQKYGEELYVGGLEVRHLDNVCSNNAESNIALGTKSQNAMDKPKETRVRVAGLANLKHNYAAIQAFYQGTKSYKRTMAQFALTSKGTLNYILKSKPDSAEVAA
jgi:hypothetical protein